MLGGATVCSSGIRLQSNELTVIDMEAKNIKYVRAARRVPEEERWQVDNLELAKGVPWNTEAGDADADGEAPGFDFKHGLGARITGGGGGRRSRPATTP